MQILYSGEALLAQGYSLLVKTRVYVSLFWLDLFILNDFFKMPQVMLAFSSINKLQISELHLVIDLLLICKPHTFWKVAHSLHIFLTSQGDF